MVTADLEETMGDLIWFQIVEGACHGRGTNYTKIIGLLRESEHYRLARQRFNAGASEKVVRMFLDRALSEILTPPTAA